jgi:hypothetical protein
MTPLSVSPKSDGRTLDHGKRVGGGRVPARNLPAQIVLSAGMDKALLKGRVQRNARKSCTIESVTIRTPTAVINPRAEPA